jgi:hypothetical protein
MTVVSIVVGIVSFGVGLMAASAFYGGTITSLGGAFAAIGTAATGGFWGGVLAGAVGGSIAGGVNAALGGGDLGDIFKGALIGGIQGAASAGIGHGSWLSAGTLGPSGSAIAQTAAHGILGGTVNEAMGGKFQDGFLSAAAGKAATFMPGLGQFLDPDSGQGNILTRTALAATIGGTASALGGGKFANGAKTAAMQHLFNEEAIHAGARWFMPDIKNSKLLHTITEDDNMGQDLLRFPEVRRALNIVDNTPGIAATKWSRSLAQESKTSYVKSFFWDLLVNRSRALVGSIRGTIYRDSNGWVHVTGGDKLGLASATHKPPSGGTYGSSLIGNNKFGRNGFGGDVIMAFDVKVYRPYRGKNFYDNYNK